MLDPNGPQEFETVVVEKYKREDHKDAFIRVQDFRPGHEGKILTVAPSGLFEKVSKGDRVIVVAGRGLFVWWFKELQLASRLTSRCGVGPPRTIAVDRVPSGSAAQICAGRHVVVMGRKS